MLRDLETRFSRDSDPRPRRSRRQALAPAYSLISLGAVVAALLVLRFGIQEAVASALAFAPNSDQSGPRPGALPIPTGLARRGAFAFEASVSDPPAKLESWIVEPGPRTPIKGTIVLLRGARIG